MDDVVGLSGRERHVESSSITRVFRSDEKAHPTIRHDQASKEGKRKKSSKMSWFGVVVFGCPAERAVTRRDRFGLHSERPQPKA
jgi:hypothetical protein